MTFRDLPELVARLESDPRIHPNTELSVSYLVYDSETQTWEPETKPLLAIALDNHELVFSCDAAEPALAR